MSAPEILEHNNTTDGGVMPDAKNERPKVKPFAQFLHEQRRGHAHAELSDLLAEVVHAVDEHRKVGSLTLQIKVKPTGDGQVQITDQVKTQVPEGDKAPSIFFYDEHGNLSREDPRQRDFDNEGLRDVVSEQRGRKTVAS